MGSLTGVLSLLPGSWVPHGQPGEAVEANHQSALGVLSTRELVFDFTGVPVLPGIQEAQVRHIAGPAHTPQWRLERLVTHELRRSTLVSVGGKGTV